MLLKLKRLLFFCLLVSFHCHWLDFLPLNFHFSRQQLLFSLRSLKPWLWLLRLFFLSSLFFVYFFGQHSLLTLPLLPFSFVDSLIPFLGFDFLLFGVNIFLNVCEDDSLLFLMHFFSSEFACGLASFLLPGEFLLQFSFQMLALKYIPLDLSLLGNFQRLV